jgi:short-subunit dehydrogenase
MGLQVARQLAVRGANVVIVARDQEKLRQGIEYIMVRHLAIEFV